MDVIADDFDYNFFPENPNWNYRLIFNEPPDPTKLCPVTNYDPYSWKNLCTSQNIYLNESSGWNEFICGFGGAIAGHMNWFPVKYDGNVYWSDHSGDDDDYNFKMCRNDKALYTSCNDHLQLEFDSDETVDRWHDTHTWWDNFHSAVNSSDDVAHAKIDGNYAIILGLLGLDGGHPDFSAELHPVYGMFVHTEDNPVDDRWAFFIRNWGNEGYCSSNQENLYLYQMEVILPHANTEDVTVNNYNIMGNKNHPNMTVSYQKCDEGVLMTFTFDVPEDQCAFEGDISFSWTGANLSPRNDFNQNPLVEINCMPGPDVEPQSDVVNLDLVGKMNRLDSPSKKQLQNLIESKTREWQSEMGLKTDLEPVTAVRKLAKANIDSIRKEIRILRKRKICLTTGHFSDPFQIVWEQQSKAEDRR